MLHLMSESHSSPEPIARSIGSRVRALRQQRGLTADALALRANISRRTLMNVEHGQSNASIGILLRIAEALDVSLATLVETVDTAPLRVQRAAELPSLWSGEFGGNGTLVGAIETTHIVELWEWRLMPGEFHQSEPHTRGTREIIHVRSGTLALEVGIHIEMLNAGDAATLFGDETHIYRCSSPTPVTFSMAVIEPKRGKHLDH